METNDRIKFQDDNMLVSLRKRMNEYFLKNTNNVLIDIPFTEHLNTIQMLLEAALSSRILFGSHTPFFYTRAALMKLQAPELKKTDRENIAYKNAVKIFSWC